MAVKGKMWFVGPSSAQWNGKSALYFTKLHVVFSRLQHQTVEKCTSASWRTTGESPERHSTAARLLIDCFVFKFQNRWWVRLQRSDQCPRNHPNTAGSFEYIDLIFRWAEVCWQWKWGNVWEKLESRRVISQFLTRIIRWKVIGIRVCVWGEGDVWMMDDTGKSGTWQLRSEYLNCFVQKAIF